MLKELQKIGADTQSGAPDLVGPFARTMALVFDDRRKCTNVFGGRVGWILPGWVVRESVACAAVRENVKLCQKSMDPRRGNWRVSSMGWSEIVREFWVADLIGRPRGDGGRFWPPWLVGVGCLLGLAFFFEVSL